MLSKGNLSMSSVSLKVQYELQRLSVILNFLNVQKFKNFKEQLLLIPTGSTSSFTTS